MFCRQRWHCSCTVVVAVRCSQTSASPPATGRSWPLADHGMAGASGATVARLSASRAMPACGHSPCTVSPLRQKASNSMARGSKRSFMVANGA